MQTFLQTFAANETWTLNVPGKYFSVLQATNTLNVRFYKGGQKLDLGEINGLGVGLEVGPLAGPLEPASFDRIEIDVTGPDTVKIGIGNGQVRYNNAVATVTVAANAVAKVGTITQTNPAITVASTQILAANANRQFLVLQNKDGAAGVYVNFGNTATVATGILIGPGQDYPCPGIVPTTAINAIGLAANANFVIAEG